MTALSGGLAAGIQAARHLAIVPNGRPDDGDVSVVTIDEFTRQEEDGAEALVGTDEESLIPVGGDVMFYGDGGAGKTTLCIDLACHLAAGEDWLDIPVARPARVLIVENEGPRPPFRKKLRRKLDSWQGGPVGDRLLVLENPWGRFSFATPDWRQAIADTVKEREVDVLVAGPLTRIGMDEAGTLQEVVAFVGLVAEVRERAGRPLVVVLVHHENKGGAVSGAWEGAGDTLFHVAALVHGRTRLHVQKARWASEHHKRTIELEWGEGESFAVTDRPVVDDDEIREQISKLSRPIPARLGRRSRRPSGGTERSCARSATSCSGRVRSSTS